MAAPPASASSSQPRPAHAAAADLRQRLGLARADGTHQQTWAQKPLRIAFIHPDLGIGGAERLVVDVALGLQERGHRVQILTSHHDPNHCFEPTRDGTLKVQVVRTAIPRSFLHLFHLPLAILRQLSLLVQLLAALLIFQFPGSVPQPLARLLTSVPALEPFDVYFVDQLPSLVPWLRMLTATRVVFYCHYPDKEVGSSIAKQKAIARGEKSTGLLRAIYRVPLDLFEEAATGTADKLLVNSSFTQAQFTKSFPRIRRNPRVVWPGIDVREYTKERVERDTAKLIKDHETSASTGGGGAAGGAAAAAATIPIAATELARKQCVRQLCLSTDQELLLSINRFEAKKNVSLAIDTFAAVYKERQRQLEQQQQQQQSQQSPVRLVVPGSGVSASAANAATATKRPSMRLIVAGGYDPRVRDNVETLRELEEQCRELRLVSETLFYNLPRGEPPMAAPQPAHLAVASVVFLPSLPGALLRSLLLNARVRMLLYTPPDEHFGIVPLEAMACGVPVLAANSGGPLESVVDASAEVVVAPTSSAAAASGTAAGGAKLVFNDPKGTGLLRPPVKSHWTSAALTLLEMDEAQRARMAEAARERVRDEFSLDAMTDKMEKAVRDTWELGPVRGDEGLYQWTFALFMFVLMSTTFVGYLALLNAGPESVGVMGWLYEFKKNSGGRIRGGG